MFKIVLYDLLAYQQRAAGDVTSRRRLTFIDFHLIETLQKWSCQVQKLWQILLPNAFSFMGALPLTPSPGAVPLVLAAGSDPAPLYTLAVQCSPWVPTLILLWMCLWCASSIILITGSHSTKENEKLSAQFISRTANRAFKMCHITVTWETFVVGVHDKEAGSSAGSW